MVRLYNFISVHLRWGLQYHTSHLCKNKEKFVTLLFWTRMILANMGSLQAVIVTEYNIKSPGWCYLDIKEKMKSSYVWGNYLILQTIRKLSQSLLWKAYIYVSEFLNQKRFTTKLSYVREIRLRDLLMLTMGITWKSNL